MTSSRIFRLLLAVLAVGAVTLPLSSAGAVTRETFVVKGLDPIVKNYGPIPGNFPLTTAVNWTPSGCADGGPGSAQCDKIPIEVTVPASVGPADDWYVVFEVSWDDPEGLNDLDVYLWDDTQISREAGGTSYTRLDQSATADNPEKVKLFAPTRGKYNLTVLNWAGPNLGYTVKAQVFIASFEAPFEVLAPDFSAPSGGGEDFSESPPPVDYSADPGAGAGPVFAPPRFGEVAVGADDDFDDFGASDFEQQLTAPPPAAFNDPRLTTTRPPKDVPGLVAAFWFGVFPLALVGGAGALLVRHSRGQLALG